STTRWPRAASPTGPPTTAADRLNGRAPRWRHPRGPAPAAGRTRGSLSVLGGVVLGHQFVQDGGELAEAFQVSPGQLVQDPVAVTGQPDPDHPAVFPVRHPLHQLGGFGPVDELDRAV